MNKDHISDVTSLNVLAAATKGLLSLQELNKELQMVDGGGFSKKGGRGMRNMGPAYNMNAQMDYF